MVAGTAEPVSPAGRMPAGWWLVDKIIVTYFAGAAALILAYYGRVPHAGWLILAHFAGIALIAFYASHPDAPEALVFRHWYPLPFVASCYKVMSLIIPAVRGRDYDVALARIDYAIWGAHPSVWLERITFPWLTEILQLLYALFIPCVLAVAGLLWARRRYAEFRLYAIVISLGYLLSYLGYLAVPARGPRFLLNALQTHELSGLLLFEAVRRLLDVLESAHYDCFPSGHTALTMLAWWYSQWLSRGLFYLYSFYTLSIVFATVYLRYHYTVDILAGAILAWAIILTAPLNSTARER